MSFLKHFLIFVCLVEELVSAEEDIKYEEKWFNQYLDHFNVWDNTTFFMRYFENNEFFKRGGPLLLEIGGEETADTASLTASPSYTLAKKLGGKVVLLEHRYYGESKPFDNFTTETLKYLSVEQALEDLAYFVESIKKSTPGLENSKVAVFGCSYSATLATWFRYKFPHLIDAAWASSGPLKVILDFYEYYEVAGEVYSNVSSECIAIIRQGYRETKQKLSTPEGEEEVKTVFKDWECGNVTEMSPESILAIIRMVVSNQYGSPNYGMESCKFLQSKNATTTCFQQLSEFVLSKAEEICFQVEPNDDLAWNYQTCSQFGYSFTTSSRSPFRDNFSAIEDDVEACSDNFGEEFNLEALKRSIARMNRVYGSTNLKVTRVITVHGTHDPWHRVGLYHEIDNKEAPVLLIPGTSHCADMNDKNEAPQLTKAKKIALEIMDRWIRS